MILLAVFDNKIIPVIKGKDMEFELLLNEMNKIRKNHKHFYKWDNEKVNFGSFAI